MSVLTTFFALAFSGIIDEFIYARCECGNIFHLRTDFCVACNSVTDYAEEKKVKKMSPMDLNIQKKLALIELEKEIEKQERRVREENYHLGRLLKKKEILSRE